MKDCTKQKYTSVCLTLIEMLNNVKQTWADCDLDSLENIIAIIRYYRQFAK